MPEEDSAEEEEEETGETQLFRRPLSRIGEREGRPIVCRRFTIQASEDAIEVGQ